MDAGIFARAQQREPVLLTALLTIVGGFVAQAGPGHIPSVKALGTSLTVGGLQGILTRTRVISPSTFRAGTAAKVLHDPRTWLAQGAEPALAMSLFGFLGGFLVQLVGGATDLLQALGISAGLAGTQGALTRQQVFSPQTVAMSLLSPGTDFGGLLTAGPEAPVEPTAQATAAVVVRTTTAPATTSEDPGLVSLLSRYCPEIRYDSLESFFADWAGVITNRQSNALKRQDGSVIATAGVGAVPLTLEFLRPGQYPNGAAVDPTDYVDEVGSDYVAQAHAMRGDEQYANKVHGRVAIDAAGTRWLQYWFFMYYDDPGFLGFGTHEGDIEMIQLRLNANGQPDAASYSQHRSGVSATWSQLELTGSPDGPVPVTYSARGSHANLLRAGTQFSLRSFLPDHNDGDGPKVRPDLIVLSDTGTAWALWPGTWGSTRATGPLGDVGIAANSPAALVHHDAWRDPAGFHANCDPATGLAAPGQLVAAPSVAPPKPTLSVQQSATGPVVSYEIPQDHTRPTPTKLVVGVRTAGSNEPARTVTEYLRGSAGAVALPTSAAPPLEVRATTHAEDGTPSETAVETL